jgi:hypothetical protein
LATTAYVDAQVSAGAADASTTSKGIVKLAGDLAGTYSSASAPVISDNAITSGKIANLSVTDAKIVGVSGSKVTGTVAVANGGTGASTLTANNVLLGNGTSALQVVAPGASGNVLTSNGTTWSSSAPQNLANTISGVVPVANGGTGLSSLTAGGAVYASSSSALTTGTLPLMAGGTGVTSQQAAINTLTGTQSAGKYLRSDGTDARLSTIQAADVPTLNQNTTGTAANVTGIVPVANGGTGVTTSTGTGNVVLSSSPAFLGTPTAPTANAGTNTTQVATTAFVTTAVAAAASSVRLNSDEFTAASIQTIFIFTTASSNTGAVQTPLSKPYMYINGTRIKNSAYSWTTGTTTVTYNPNNNNNYALVAGDRIQFDYAY